MPRPTLSAITLTIATLPLLSRPGPAFADPGHLADLAGHDHWIAGAALGLAGLAALWGALTGRPRQADTGSAPSPEQEDQTA